MSLGFKVERIDDVIVDGPEDLLAKNLMSPFMWRADRDAGLMALIRAVPPQKRDDEQSGRIWYGRSASDSLVFRMDATPVLKPKQGLALPNAKGETNSKEATPLPDGGVWRLLYEYAHDGHSLISLADGQNANGPWQEHPDPLSPRPSKWDSWHLSTGPLLRSNSEQPVMFYRGANGRADRGIGWAALTADLRKTISRCDGSLIAPPSDATRPRDIAFEASVIGTHGTIWLYYSRNDRKLKRAPIRQTG